jgi:hypothetical protein
MVLVLSLPARKVRYRLSSTVLTAARDPVQEQGEERSGIALKCSPVRCSCDDRRAPWHHT